MLSILLLAPSAWAGTSDDRHFRGCDLADRAAVDAYNEATTHQLGDPRRAWRALQPALARQPGCYAAVTLGANLAFRLADPRGLELTLDGLRRWPDDPDLLVSAADYTFVLQDFETSLGYAAAARAADPASLPALHTEQAALVRLGRYDEALARLDASQAVESAARSCYRSMVFADQRLAEQAAADMPACRTSTHPDIVALAEARLQFVDNRPAATDPGARAVELLNAERYEEALPLLEAQYEAAQWDVTNRMNLAICLVGLGRLEKARPHLDALLSAEEWISIHPDGTLSGVVTKLAEVRFEEQLQRSSYLLVGVLLTQGELEAAAGALRKAESRFGRTAPLVAAGIDLARAQDPAGAWPKARQALRSFPEDRDVLHELARLAFADPAGIDAELTRAAAASTYPVLRRNVLAALSNAGRDAECSAYGRDLRAAPLPDEYDDVPRLAYECALRVPDLAAATALRPPDADPGLVGIHARIAWEAGDRDSGRTLAASVAETDPTGSARWVLLCDALDAGRLDEARQIAVHPQAPYDARLAVAVALYNARRHAEAAALLDGFDCARLGEHAERCRATVATVRAGGG